MKRALNLFMTVCMALIMVLMPCMEVKAEGNNKATVNVEIQNVFNDFKSDISLCLRNPSSDDIKEFKNGVVSNVSFEVETFGECSLLTIEQSGEWCFVDATTLKAPKSFNVKENDVVNVSLLLFPTEKNAEYGEYIKIYEESINALMDNEVIADALSDLGIGSDDSSISINNHSEGFDFERWHDGAMASFNNFNELFSDIEEDSTWQGYLANAEIRRNVSLNYYLNSVHGAEESTWLNMSKTDIFLWQNTYLVFVEMIDKGNDYFTKTFANQQTIDKWLKSIICTSSWTGNGNEEIYNAYVEWLDYQIEYYRYYGYPYNFINDKSYAEETSLFPSSSEENEEISSDELSDEEIAELEEDINHDKNEDSVIKKTKNNWVDVFEKLKGMWITLILIVVVGSAYFIVHKIRKSKNYDDMSN